jgi:MFS family permease
MPRSAAIVRADKQRVLAGNRDFSLMRIGDAVSQVGSQLTLVALPLLAVLDLRASSFEVALISSAGYLAWLLVGLPAGAWVERRPRRPILISADIARAVLLASIPVAALVHRITLAQVYVIALAISLLSTVFDVAYPAYLPRVLEGRQLAAGNARLQINSSLAVLIGPSAAGLLVQAVGAPSTLLVDCVSFVVSAACLSWVRRTEPAAVSSTETRSLGHEIAEGLRYVRSHPALRAIAASCASFNLFFAGYQALVIVFLVRVARVPTGAVGILVAAGGVGGIIGAVKIGWLTNQLGAARLIWAVPVATIPFSLLIPLAEHGWRLVFFVAGALISGVGAIVFGVSVGTFIQINTPGHLLARVVSCIRVLSRGALPIGAAVAGSLTKVWSIRTLLLLAAIGMSLSLIPIIASPLRQMHDLVKDTGRNS